MKYLVQNVHPLHQNVYIVDPTVGEKNIIATTTLEELPELPKYKLDENEQIVIDEIIEDGLYLEEPDLITTTIKLPQELLDNPFKGPSERRVLRVDINGKIKLYSKYKISKYIGKFDIVKRSAKKYDKYKYK